MKKLKTDGPPLRSFDQIQKEIRAEQGTIRNLGGTVETASKEQAEAGQIRDDTAYPALALADASALEKLAEAEDRLSRAAHRLESARKAMAVAERRLAALEAEAEIAYKREEREKAHALMRQSQTEADAIDSHFMQGAALLQKHVSTFDAIRNHLYEAGASESEMTRFKLTHFTRVLGNFYFKQIFPTGFSIEISKQYERPYSEIIAQVIGAAEHKAQPNGEDRGSAVDGGVQDTANEANAAV